MNQLSDSQLKQIQELKNLVEFRTKFHNMIVHDLRAPSNSIQMSAEQALLSIKNMKRQCFKQGFDSFLKQYKHTNQQNIPPIKKRRAPVRKQSSCKNIFIDDENEHDVIRVKEIQYKNFTDKRISEKKSFKNNFFNLKLIQKLSIIKSEESSSSSGSEFSIKMDRFNGKKAQVSSISSNSLESFQNIVSPQRRRCNSKV